MIWKRKGPEVINVDTVMEKELVVYSAIEQLRLEIEEGGPSWQVH